MKYIYREREKDLGCVGKEHRRGIIHLQGIILFLAGLLAETRARASLSPISSPYLPAPSLFGSRKNRGMAVSIV